MSRGVTEYVPGRQHVRGEVTERIGLRAGDDVAVLRDADLGARERLVGRGVRHGAGDVGLNGRPGRPRMMQRGERIRARWTEKEEQRGGEPGHVGPRRRGHLGDGRRDRKPIEPLYRRAITLRPSRASAVW